MRARIIVFAILLGAVWAAVASPGTGADGAPAPTSCRAQQWCTITAAGISSSVAAQFAIGNVRRGTVLAITQYDIKHRQVGGQIVDGDMAGTCAWSQYQRDWAPLLVATADQLHRPAVPQQPVHRRRRQGDLVGLLRAAALLGRRAAASYDRRCGKRGRTFCYSSNCEEYANFYPWTPDAHPSDPLRETRRHVLAVRYLARFGDVWTNSPFYLVMDTAIGHGQADWVFVSGRACGIVTGPVGTYHSVPRHQ